MMQHANNVQQYSTARPIMCSPDRCKQGCLARAATALRIENVDNVPSNGSWNVLQQEREFPKAVSDGKNFVISPLLSHERTEEVG